MTTELDQNVAVRQQLEQIDRWDTALLRKRYQEYFHADPGALPDSFLRGRIAYHFQRMSYGGLTEVEQKILLGRGRKDTKVNPAARPVTASTSANAVYERLYKGETIRLEVLGDHRFACRGKVFNSPTAAAVYVTGTHISGKAFFGITD